KSAVEQASNHFLRDTHGHANFRFWIALSQLPQWTAQLVDQGSNAGRKMEGANVFLQIVFKGPLDVAHHLHDFLGMLSEAQGRRSGNQPFSTPYEKVRVKFVRKVMELQADGAG